MGGVLRTVGWIWLSLGLGTLAVQLMRLRGLFLPIPDQMHVHMARPWSMLLYYLGIAEPAATMLVAIGIIINATIFMVIGNILDR